MGTKRARSTGDHSAFSVLESWHRGKVARRAHREGMQVSEVTVLAVDRLAQERTDLQMEVAAQPGMFWPGTESMFRKCGVHRAIRGQVQQRSPRAKFAKQRRIAGSLLAAKTAETTRWRAWLFFSA